MKNCVILYTVVQSPATITSSDPIEHLRQAIEGRGDCVVGSFVDYGPEVRLRQRNVGWKNVLASLDGVDQLAVVSAADLPGKTVKDLIRFLDCLRDSEVSLFLLNEGIDTGNGSAAFLDLITAYRAAKLSQAIRRGQSKSNKRTGRPPVPLIVRQRIEACLLAGGGTRATAKKFAVSPGTIVAIRRSMTVTSIAEAA